MMTITCSASNTRALVECPLNKPITLSQLHTDLDNNHTSVTSIKQLQKKWGLQSTCQQQCTFESIADAVQTIHKSYPSWGAEMIWKQLRIKFGIWAPRWAHHIFTQCSFYFISMQGGDHGIPEEDWTRCCQGLQPSMLQTQAFPRSRCQWCVVSWSTW